MKVSRPLIVVIGLLTLVASHHEATARQRRVVETPNIFSAVFGSQGTTAQAQVRVRHGKRAAVNTVVITPSAEYETGRTYPSSYPMERIGPRGRQIRDTVSWATAGISQPARYIGGRLVCAVNVNAELARRGIQGTGSAMAKSFLNWGRSTSPTPGAVAVYHRGGPRSKSGHVAIVSRVENGVVYIWNPGRGGWREVPQHRAALDYRLPG